MELQKGDFIEIDFTGRVKDGEIFDSTLKEDLEKLHHGHDHEIKTEPLVFCLGRSMFLKSIDDFLIGKEIGKTYEIELSPEQAFGNRDSRLVQMVPMDVFRKQNINPVPGYSLNFDGRVGKILTVSGGRVMIDFNHSLVGKTVDYTLKIIRKIDDINEKIKALNEFFFRKNFKFEIKENKIIIEAEKQFIRIIPLFADKFREMLGFDLEIKEVEEQDEKREEQAKKEQ